MKSLTATITILSLMGIALSQKETGVLIGNKCDYANCKCEDGGKARKMKIGSKQQINVCLPLNAVNCAPNIRCQCCSDFFGALSK